MAYPDTLLNDGEVDPLYGGEAGRSIGGPAWDWVANVILAAQTLLVAHVFRPYRMQKVKVANAVAAGDVLCEDLNGSATDYTIVRYLDLAAYDPDLTPRYGIAAEPASQGAKCWAVLDGCGIPPNIHGLAAGSAGNVRINTTSGKLERADGTPGEIVVGKINSKGYVRIWPRHGSNE